MPVPLPQVSVSPLPLDPRTYDVALACVHCGLCLPACPTYLQTGHEADSPRGRIQLLRALADGAIPATASVQRHLELCLDCRACETSCPSGIIYHELIEEARLYLEKQKPSATGDRILQWVFLNVFTRPTRLKLALLGPRILQKLALSGLLRLGGGKWAKLARMLPQEGGLWPAKLPEYVAAKCAKKMRVGLFGGCVGSVVQQEVNRQAAELLALAGAELIVPRQQVCCGAIHHHNADREGAKALARRNIDVFLSAENEVDCIVTTAGGCGTMLKEYDFLFRDDPEYGQRAEQFMSKVRDVSEVLLELGLPPMKNSIDQTVTYHDSCHLAHGQRVIDAPRELLSRIPGLKVVPLAESDVCCGAAGTYNLTQPEMAGELAQRKLKNIAATGAKVCVMGNVGCAMHLQAEAAARGMELRVVHPVELLRQAMG